MRPIGILLCALYASALWSCGSAPGGGVGLPAASGSGTLLPQGSTVAFEKKTLWVADSQYVTVYPAKGDGGGAPLRQFTGNAWPDGPVGSGLPEDVTVAPDGTAWILLGNGIDGGPLRSTAWRLVAYYPGETNLSNYEARYDGTGTPGMVALGGDGVLVQSDYTITTYPYAAHDPPAMRTFHISPGHGTSFVVDANGRIYLSRSNGFDVYDRASDGSAPVEQINITGTQSLGRGMYAVGPDGSIYTEDLVGFHDGQTPKNGATAYVNVYPPGSGTVARRIGPVPIPNGSGATAPVITVDVVNRLYLATPTVIYCFARNANGSAPQMRTMTNQTQLYPRGLAIGP